MIKTAVILAAGVGERLKPITNVCPKPLIKISGKTLIEHSLDNIKKNGIKEVIIVVGHLGDLIKEKIGNFYHGIKISYVVNKEYSQTGSAYSLYQARKIIDEDILLLESDLLYEEKALKLLLGSPETNLILIAPISGSGDEVFIEIDGSNNLINLGKTIRNKERACGELVGITKLSLPFLKKIFETVKKDYKKNKKQYHYEETIFKASKTHPVKCLVCKDLIWTEIDTENNLEKAKKYL